jgi:diaminohydroxyphosphoribosylaminopyrimidine deaminase/5-amino-6-(5-phosphoribosylamino)uracil reductase
VIEPPDDAAWMRRALKLAARGRGRTAPNPMVGAVVVRDGRVVGEGYHPRAGEPHAEVFALRDAGGAAAGATLYATLEPCCHHGRTPPCTDAILASGVRRLVAAMGDPFPKVSGGGFRVLREAGLDVEGGLLEAEAMDLNRAYLKVQLTGLPWVTLKMAMTLDGKISTRTGDSRWVTGETARRHAHRLRNWNDAVLVGSGTALADDPELTARLPGARNPVRVIADGRARLPLSSKLATTAHEVPTLLLTATAAATGALEARGIQVERIPQVADKLDLTVALARLAERGLHSIVCEGGAGLAAGLLEAGLVDEVAWFIAPKLVGGRDAPGPIGGTGVENMVEAIQLENIRLRRLGPDLLLTARTPERPNA